MNGAYMSRLENRYGLNVYVPCILRIYFAHVPWVTAGMSGVYQNPMSRTAGNMPGTAGDATY